MPDTTPAVACSVAPATPGGTGNAFFWPGGRPRGRFCCCCCCECGCCCELGNSAAASGIVAVEDGRVSAGGPVEVGPLRGLFLEPGGLPRGLPWTLPRPLPFPKLSKLPGVPAACVSTAGAGVSSTAGGVGNTVNASSAGTGASPEDDGSATAAARAAEASLVAADAAQTPGAEMSWNCSVDSAMACVPAAGGLIVALALVAAAAAA
mmetsp:Transcript_7174/g.21104  ORF Transcript_7174/g.21104 Transcript_7174/m.21104 type:complete len:207 (-) Transcript_7174:2626-3246(-)